MIGAVDAIGEFIVDTFRDLYYRVGCYLASADLKSFSLVAFGQRF